ncbi:hypothetical protein ACFQ60_03780 [Streptomyces zhihengii]
MNSNLPYAVHISRDGRLHINGEPTVIPDGVDPSQVVLRILHMEAAASGTPSWPTSGTTGAAPSSTSRSCPTERPSPYYPHGP